VARLPVDAELLASPLVLRLHSQGLLYRYQTSDQLAARGPYDCVIIDAPPGAFGRDTALYQALPHLSHGALIVLDDAARVQEGTVVRRWLRACRGLQLLYWDKEFARGVAVLRHTGDATLRISPRNVLGAFHDRWVFRRLVQVLRQQDASQQ
jgi:hypothetical protein